MKRKRTTLVACMLALTLVAMSLLTGCSMSEVSGGFSKTETDQFTLYIDIGARQPALEYIDIATQLIKGGNLATHEEHTENGITYTRLIATGEDCYVRPLQSTDASLGGGHNAHTYILPRFLYLLYRTPYTATAQIFAGSSGGDSEAMSMTFDYNGDENWHLMRIDLYKDGVGNLITNMYNYLRYDFFTDGKGKPYIDVAMLAWFRCDADAEDTVRKNCGLSLTVEKAKQGSAELEQSTVDAMVNPATYGLTCLKTDNASYKIYENTNKDNAVRYAACINCVDGEAVDTGVRYLTAADGVVTHIGPWIQEKLGTGADKQIAFDGWALIRSGHGGEFYWSVDKVHWIPFQIKNLQNASEAEFQATLDLTGKLGGDFKDQGYDSLAAQAVIKDARFKELAVDFSACDAGGTTPFYIAMRKTGGTTQGFVVFVEITNLTIG